MARKPSLSPTLHVIAQKLGISLATVSRAIRNAEGIHSDTRALVLQSARELGYVIPKRRNSIDARQRHQVLVLSLSGAQDADRRYLTGISRAAIPLSIVLLAHYVTADACEKIMSPENQPTAMQEGLVDGLVLLRYWPPEIVAQLSAKWPTVSVVHNYPGSTADCVGIDDQSGMELIVRHLVRGGHQKIGFFGYCQEVSWSCSRHAGYVEATTKQRLPYQSRNTVELGLSEVLSGRASADNGWGEKVLARMKGGVDAWVCSNMGSAWELSRFFCARGIRIPDDVAVTGYHKNVGDTAELPPLTTTGTLDEDIGAAALRMLLHRFAYPRDTKQSLLLSPPLLVGASTRAEQS